jgi:transcriptional regulator with XRE-family HTH domain
MRRHESETFAARLRRLREASGHSQAALAARAGIPAGTLRNWEQGIREPRPGALVKLALALEVSADLLLGLDEQPQEQPAPKRGRGRPSKPLAAAHDGPPAGLAFGPRKARKKS